MLLPHSDDLVVVLLPHSDDLVVVLLPHSDDLVVLERPHSEDLPPQASEDAPRPKVAVAASVNVAVVNLRNIVLCMRVPCLRIQAIGQCGRCALS